MEVRGSTLTFLFALEIGDDEATTRLDGIQRRLTTAPCPRASRLAAGCHPESS
jgi:hypothetical protein